MSSDRSMTNAGTPLRYPYLTSLLFISSIVTLSCEHACCHQPRVDCVDHHTVCLPLHMGRIQGSSSIPVQAVPGDKALRTRVLSFLHRMVESLGPHLLPMLPSAVRSLLPADSQAPALTDVLALLHQLAVRYKAALEPLMSEVRLGPNGPRPLYSAPRA